MKLLRVRKPSCWRGLPLSLLFGALLVCGNSLASQTTQYTTDDDFLLGILQGLNLDVPDQLQVDPASVQTFPFLYIANAGEDTVSKIDTNIDQEVARYRTWFQVGTHGAWSGPAPSRTAVDGDGNVYIANRGFGGFYGRDEYTYVIKILAAGGIDRNGNGIIDTSSDGYDGSVPNGLIEASEILPIIDDNGNGVFEVEEARDERIAWVTEIPSSSRMLGRSLSIAPNGNIWVGLYSARVYYELDGADGAILSGPHSVAPHTPYGSLIDGNGILWGASLSNNLLRLNTNNPSDYSVHVHSGSDYGIAIARGDAGQTIVYKANAAYPYLRYDSLTDTFTDPSSFGYTSYGISADGAGNVYMTGSNVSGSRDGMSKLAPDGTLIWSSGAQPGTNTGANRGAVLDSNGDVWAVGHPASLIGKYDGPTGAPLGTVGVGLVPYTYSDASGSSFIYTNPFGSWTILHDTGVPDCDNAQISWLAEVPGDSGLSVAMDASNTGDDYSDYSTASLTPVTNGDVQPVQGRYLYLRVTLTPGTEPAADPIFHELTVNVPLAQDICGDLDKDGDVDIADRDIFMTSYRSCQGDPSYIAETDYDGDGCVTMYDYRSWYICYKQYRSSL